MRLFPNRLLSQSTTGVQANALTQTRHFEASTKIAAVSVEVLHESALFCLLSIQGIAAFSCKIPLHCSTVWVLTLTLGMDVVSLQTLGKMG